ncbi:hypothetical protein [Streptomyces sp. NPDC055287]
MLGEPGPGRFLIATAVTRYPKAPKHLRWDRPGLSDACDRVIGLFTGQLGYQHASALGLDPTAGQLTEQLRAFCTSPERHPEDLITVYIASHGEILEDGEHVLLTSDTDPQDIDDALPTLTLARKMLRGTKVRRLLLLLDTCFSGQGGNELAASALTRMNRQWGAEPGAGFVVVTSAQPNEQADTGAFPHLLEQAVSTLATAGHGPETLALSTVVQQMNDHHDRPGYQRIGWNAIGLTGTLPPFLPNPRHDARLTDVDLALQQRFEWEQQAERREVEYRTRLLVRAMGHSDPERLGWWFCGRHEALADITDWLRSAPAMKSGREPAVLAVTAGPGSGKTAVLGLLATLTDPERRRTVPLGSMGLPHRIVPPDGALDVAVYAQNLTDTQVLQGIAAAARVKASTAGELLDALVDRTSDRGHPFTVMIDALDEAATPETLCSQLLRPLIDHHQGRIRLLLGTRPHLLPQLGLTRDQHIDLDVDRYADPAALSLYTVRNLIEAHPDSPYLTCPRPQRQAIANQVATAAGRSFLVARITAGTLAATPELPHPADPAWRASLPRLAGEAMHRDLTERLRHDADRAADLLRPLAFAEGQGLPWEDLWAPLASALSGYPYADEDLLWLRRQAGAYIVEATEADRSAYRLYHQAMAEHLRKETDPAAVQSAFTRTLIARVPYRSDGTRDWPRAHPYTLRYLASHAAHGGLLGGVITDPEYLVHAHPDNLMPHLHTIQSDPAGLPATVYRTCIGSHRHTIPATRRQVLALGAARYNSPPLLTALNDQADNHAWIPVYATGGTLSPALRNTFAGHTGPVRALACTTLDGLPVAVTGSADRTVRVWDLTTGRQIGHPLTGHTDTVNALACTELDGRPIAVTGSDDRMVRVWDLTTRQPLGRPLTGHERSVNAVACTTLDGLPVAVTGSDDRTVRVWDLTTGRQIGRPLTGHTSSVRALECATLKGRPVAVTSSGDQKLRVWDLTTQQPLRPHRWGLWDSAGQFLSWEYGTDLAYTTLEGRPVTVTGSWNHRVRVWDLTTGRQIGHPLTGHTDTVNAVACTTLDGLPVAVTGSADHTVRIWDLTTRRQIGHPLTGHSSTVIAVACTTLDGLPVAVTGSADHTVRIWDLTTKQQLPGNPSTGHTGQVNTVACTTVDGRPIAVTGSRDHTVRIWDLTTKQPVARPLTGHSKKVTAVACTTVDGRPIAVTGSRDHTVRVWDLTTKQPVARPLIVSSSWDRTAHVWDVTRQVLDGGFVSDTSKVTAVACTVLDGRPVALIASHGHAVRVWDLTTGRQFGHPLTGHTNTVNALACTELDGRPIAVTGSDDSTVRIWDLTTRQLLGRPLTGHKSLVSAVGCTELDGRPIAATGGLDRMVRVWDLTTRQLLGHPLAGHTSPVNALACATVDGRPIAVTGGHDCTMRIWDLERLAPIGVLYLPHPCSAVSATDEGLLICCFGNDVAVFSQRLVE